MIPILLQDIEYGIREGVVDADIERDELTVMRRGDATTALVIRRRRVCGISCALEVYARTPLGITTIDLGRSDRGPIYRLLDRLYRERRENDRAQLPAFVRRLAEAKADGAGQ